MTGETLGHDHDHDHGHGHDHDHGCDQGHGHDYDHGDDHGHGHGHEHGGGHKRWRPHSHDAAGKVDAALESSAAGLRALRGSLLILAGTAALQAAVAAWSHSVALLGDTLHNAADALTAVPLAIAFLLGRRAATRRFTYGYGRAEDLAGVAIVLTVAASAVLAGYQAIGRLVDPRPVQHLGWVVVAAVVGVAGNEIVARYRIAVGRRIGSAALLADGLHARTDGFASLAVLLGAGGAALGWRWADPVVGLAITAAILLVLRDAAREVFARLMDAVDPGLVDRADHALRAAPGVRDVGSVRLRWIGHHLRAEADLVVDTDLSLVQAHAVAADAEHRLAHAIPRLAAATVHVDPASQPGAHHHVTVARAT